jgi:hypothetical protein
MAAIGNPNTPYVAIIESTPVMGVVIKKLVTAPLEAPFLRKEVASGITPHEHSGKGMP